MAESVVSAEQVSRRRAFRPFLIAAIALVVVFLAAAVGGGIYTSLQYRELVDLGKETQADYARLDEAYPFEPPRGAAAAPSRWEAMLSVRARALAALSPAARVQLAKLLELQSLKEVDPVYLARLLPLGGQLKAVVDAHLAALAEHEMSGEEYRWYLSQAVYQVMKETREAAPAEAAHWRVLHVAEALSRTDEDSRNDLTGEEFLERIKREYGPLERADASVTGPLRASDPVAAMLDLLAVASGWARMEQLTTQEKPAGS